MDTNAPQTEEEAREMEEYTARNRALLSEDPSMYAGLAAIDQLTEEQAEALKDEVLAQEKYESSTKFIKDAERYAKTAAAKEVGQTGTQNDVPRNDSEREAEIAQRLRDKKIGGVSFVDPLFGAIGISKTLYDGALELAAKQVEKGTAIGKAIANAIRYIDERMAGKKWDKGLFGRHLNDQFKMTVNGKEVEVKRDLSEETLEVVNGWYSPLEKSIKDSKAESLTAKEWLDRVRSKEGEDLWTGLRGMLEAKKPKDRVSKRELLNYLKDNRVDVVEVVKSTGDDFQAKLSALEKKHDVTIVTDEDPMTGGMELQLSGDRIRNLSDFEYQELQEEIYAELTEGIGSPTQFHQYQLEGEKAY